MQFIQFIQFIPEKQFHTIHTVYTFFTIKTIYTIYTIYPIKVKMRGIWFLTEQSRIAFLYQPTGLPANEGRCQARWNLQGGGSARFSPGT